MISKNLIEEDSIVTTWDSFKYCILACEIGNQMHRKFKKRKVPQAISGRYIQSWLLCKTYFCSIFVPLSVAKIPEKHLRSSSFLVEAFLKENSHSPGKFTKRLYSRFTCNFYNRYFSELQFLTTDGKINRIYQQKLQTGGR